MNNQYRFFLDIPKKKGQYCVFGIPKSNQYQIIKNVLFDPKSTYTQSINPWNNSISVFLLRNIQNKITVSFSTQPISIQKEIYSSWTLSDYNIKKISHNRFIDGGNRQIQKQTKNILNDEKSVLVIAKKLYQHTLKYLTYGDPILGLYSYSQVLQNQITDCGGFSTYLLSLFQSIGIPGRLVVGFIIKKSLHSKMLSLINLKPFNFDSLSMHVWIEIQLPDESWFPIDPVMEWKRVRGLTKRLGGFGVIPHDRLVISYGEDFKVNIDRKKFIIDIIQHPIYL